LIFYILEVFDPINDSQQPQRRDPLNLSNDVKLIKTLALGGVLVIEVLWEWLGIGKESCNFSKTKKV
jgi:hypothetical protein